MIKHDETTFRHPATEEACDQIDAGFFSGDAFWPDDCLARIEYFVQRWQCEIKNIKEMKQKS